MGIEDNIRIKETKQEFDEEFINLARLVYKQMMKEIFHKNNG